VDELFAEKLAAGAMLALDKLQEMAALPVEGPIDQATRLAILREILDRSRRRRPRRWHSGKGKETFQSYVKRLSDTEMIELAKRLLASDDMPPADGRSSGAIGGVLPAGED
jgi:hypothetical protein